MPSFDLDQRSRQVLHCIIEQYISSGEPVGSRTVAKSHPEGVSAATIRNIMADLEEMGLLMQPHTSAGRVPTEWAYRSYVDGLAAKQDLTSSDRRQVQDVLRDLHGDIDQVLQQVSRCLSQLSHQVGVVLRPTVERSQLKHIEFVALEGRRVLSILVSRSGNISHRIFLLDEELKQADLDGVGRYFTEEFCGCTLVEIRGRLLKLMAEEKALYDKLLTRVLEVGRRTFEEDPGEPDAVLMGGTFRLLGQPEFSDADRMRTLFSAFEEKGRLVKILNRCLDDDGVTVIIGSEHADPAMQDTSLVASPYHYQGRVLGTLGIIGPTRMEYARNMAMVEHIARLVSETITETAK
ncbi:MAG: heat-inducible transcription repressor HrcA [Acidobacteria bacterium]|nr:MAG: heat-inducible transcription repressor HrcA [Acidobacteriota bacterium]